MKSTLSSRLAAAALLLVPVGAMLVAQPAAAEHRDWRDDRGYGYGWNRDNGNGWDRDSYRRDERPPRIFAVTPEHGDQVSDRGWTRIAARFRDRGTGVAAVTLRVDGRDVTGRARVDDDDIRYAENLMPGRHVAELVVRDGAGNTTRRAWSFDVVDTHRGWGRGWGEYGDSGQAYRW